jgi:hypothetical protein
MPEPAPGADDIVERLTAVGFEPTVTNHRDGLLVEVQVSGQVSPEAWKALLIAMELADRFGQEATRGGITAWAAVHKGTPATAPAARGRGQSALGS